MTDEFPTPRENADLHGHDEAEHFLKNAFQGGRMAHAWLISGPRGIGKATLAYRFARFVLAAGGGTAGAGPDLFGGGDEIENQGGLYVPPEHPVFRRIAAGTHVDMLGVERTVN
jgi:DNA polymerase-3 subunit delta'